MNIMAQICGMVILIIIFISYRRQKKIQLKTGRMFYALCKICAFSLSLDMLSLVCIKFQEFLPGVLVRLVCKTYVSSLVWVTIGAIFYICADVYERTSSYEIAAKTCRIVGNISTILIFVLPIYIMREENSNVAYSYGPAVLATYGTVALCFVVMSWLIVKYGKRMNPKRREGVVIWVLIWVAAAGIQFFNNELLVVGFASAVGMLVIFIRLENPETNIDRRTGMFNEGAMLLFAKQCLEQEKEFYLLALNYTQGNHDNVPSKIDREVKSELLSIMMLEDDVLMFRGSDDYILFWCNKLEKANLVMELLKTRFAKPWKNTMLTPHFAMMPDVKVARDEKDLLAIFSYAYEHDSEYGENGFIEVTEDVANAMYDEIEVETLIVEAMEQDRVEVFYQPIYSTVEKRFSSAEALARIRKEDGTIVAPGMFISVAEEKGLIIRLGKIVFEQVCRFLKENDIRKLGVDYIEVNLSVVQCGHEDLAKEFIQIMKSYDVSPEMINLEITESASLKKKQTLLDNMKALREYGVEFSLDDFGTGQSNLNYIVEMPVDIVKFDKGMTDSYFENDKAKHVLDAAMGMIQGLDLKIVSEGVETRTQYETMEELGINYIQGYYFSKPLPEKEFVDFLVARNNECGEK